MPNLLDLDLDPITRDFVDADDGTWAEVDDSRTAVFWQLEERAGESWHGDPTGSLIRKLLERPAPASAEELRDEALRALQLLVNDSILADLVVVIAEQTTGRLTLELGYTDVASGRRVDSLLVPFGGV